MESLKINHEAVMIESSLFLKPTHVNETKQNGIKKDLKKIIYLIYLYMLQGVPLGLAASIPIILASRKASYSVQGTFSFAFYPFSVKLLWAPIVDSLYMKRFGRRKSWLMPVQLLIGIFMITFASFVQKLAYNIESKTDIVILTTIFTTFTFLAATQDIALDGWAISMLSEENVAWQSTCNGIGQTAGFFIGNISIIVFESAKFCNSYIRPLFNLPSQEYGIVSLQNFMYGFGSVFLLTAFLIIFKKEDKKDAPKIGILESYMIIIKLLSLKLIQKTALFLLTVKIAFATENVSSLKLIEKGVSKETLSLISIPLVPFNILITALISKFIQKKPMISFLRVLPVRLTFCLITALIIYYVPKFKDENDKFSLIFYSILIGFMILQSLVETTMFISQMAFFASVSDVAIGGTYMTLLATLANLGGTYPGTAVLYLINFFSKKLCIVQIQTKFSNLNSTDFVKFNATTPSIINKCSTTNEIKECQKIGGSCETQFDAYYILTIGLVMFGVLWLIFFRKLIINLSNSPKTKWNLINK